jgi:putative PIG3 family NAD(P)H quinone oxidoreductase
MRAIVIREPGGPEVLELRDVPTPAPSRYDVRVRVRATAVNRADLLQRLGKYPAPPGAPRDIPGLEMAGEVDSIGAGVSELAVGDRVFGLVGGGGYGEYVVVHARALAHLGPSMAFAQAAAVPEAFLTAWDALIDQAHLKAGETVLIHAAGGGVGTAAVQIARAVGARAIGTSRSAAKIEQARALGLSDGIVIGVDDGPFAPEVLARTGGDGADVVLDLVGGPYFAQNLACLRPRGRIVVLSVTAGSRSDLDLAMVMAKRAEIRGSMLRSRPLEEKIQLAKALENHLVPLLASGALRPIVDRVLPLEQASDAHRLMQSNAIFGKIVLEV